MLESKKCYKNCTMYKLMKVINGKKYSKLQSINYNKAVNFR